MWPTGSAVLIMDSSYMANVNLKPPKEFWIVSKNHLVTAKTHRSHYDADFPALSDIQ